VARVLIWLPEDLIARLRVTLLWRPEIDRLLVNSEGELLSTIRERRPKLVILDGRRPEVMAVVRKVRSDPDTRDLSIAALLGDDVLDEQTLREAGVNVVLSKQQAEPLWDDAFQELVNVPPRRWVTLPVQVALGPRPGPNVQPAEMVARNISVRGLLIESQNPFPLGMVISIFVKLPSRADRLHLVGRVVWERSDGNELTRQGVEFLGFHGDAMGAIAAFVAASSPSGN
jgi:hypothetical protein